MFVLQLARERPNDRREGREGREERELGIWSLIVVGKVVFVVCVPGP